jgi:hypothetical protein
MNLINITLSNMNYKIIDDKYLVVIKHYNYNYNYNLSKKILYNDIKNYENYLFYLELIYLYKKKFQDYEVIIHNHCMKKFIDIYYNWHNLILKLKIYGYY